MSSKVLEMTFDPQTIEALGIQMYSTLPPVVAELIANAYDADAKIVEVFLKDSASTKEIIVADNGLGMTFDEINAKFLRIGRHRRNEEEQLTPSGRMVIGKKGLGKLSFFGIAHEIEIITKKNGKENSFLMRWDDIKNSGKPTYTPRILKLDEPCKPEDQGTKIILRELNRESDFDPEKLSIALSKIFIVDESFRVSIKHNEDTPVAIENEKKYEELEREVEWKIPVDVNMKSDYKLQGKIKGHLMTTKKPIPPRTNMRGVTLFSRKKLVNAPEYFSDSESSHFFSYLTGWLEVDFVDDLEDDVIATDRQSLRWGLPEMRDLREYLSALMNWLEQDWRKKRAGMRDDVISKKTGINVSEWLSKLPPEVKSLVEPVLRVVVSDAELPEETISSTAKKLHDIVPEYPRYHWRHLHPDVQSITKDDYVNQRYFDAAEKATRLYIQKVKDKSGIDTGNESRDMDSAFTVDHGVLRVTDCTDTTRINIQAGQHMLSKGVVSGFRNPLAHNPEYKKRLVDTGLFTEDDCLDVLSLVSHLFGRLDSSQKSTK